MHKTSEITSTVLFFQQLKRILFNKTGVQALGQ
jgi:hypothetical protein